MKHIKSWSSNRHKSMKARIQYRTQWTHSGCRSEQRRCDESSRLTGVSCIKPAADKLCTPVSLCCRHCDVGVVFSWKVWHWDTHVSSCTPALPCTTLTWPMKKQPNTVSSSFCLPPFSVCDHCWSVVLESFREQMGGVWLKSSLIKSQDGVRHGSSSSTRLLLC